MGVKPIKLDIELYETEGKYSLNFISVGNSCPVLNALFELEVNADAKERKVEQCLYYRLVNNPDVILDYKVLLPFEDIIEVDRLIEDSRLVWTDPQLLQLNAIEKDRSSILSAKAQWEAATGKTACEETLRRFLSALAQDLDV